MSRWQTSRHLVAGNLIGLACMLGLVTFIPAIAGVVKILREPWEREDIAKAIPRHIGRTFLRDLPMSLVSVLALAIGLSSTVSVFGWLTGGARVAALVALVVVYGAVGLLLAAYAHAAGTLPPTASRSEVMELAMARIQASPGRAALAVLAVWLTLPLWLFAPAAVACGITLPAWLLDRLWRPADADLL